MIHNYPSAPQGRPVPKLTGGATLGTRAASSISRAQDSGPVIGCAASHTKLMEAIVVPLRNAAIGADALFEFAPSWIDLENAASNRDAPCRFVVQMDDRVVIPG